MKISKSWSILLLAVLLAAFIFDGAFANGAGWLAGWDYRMPVEISNPCAEDLFGYQVLITLDNSFDFTLAQADGSDIRVTAEDGVTLIPSWIEKWIPASDYAGIWVKVPEIPVSGTTLYLYYGNSSLPGPDLVEVGPIGPWDRPATNPIIPAGGPVTGQRLLAENIVYDDVTGHYWLIFANYNDGTVGLTWTDDPGDPTSFTWHGAVVSSANSPHIIKHDGVWYIFYADRTVPEPWPISVDTSSSITGPYHRAATVLAPSETWETRRVDEPYVFQRNDGVWILVYMGDSGGNHEQIGYATASDILGPYTKFAGNPCIPFGPPGSYDAGTVADPWVVELDDVYYIGYTVSTTTSSPWRTALVTTEDWLTFTKQGVILDLGGPGDWDEYDAFRGAVTRFGDTYYFTYTGSPGAVGNYIMGLATQPAFMEQPVNNPEEVFEFIDTFEDDLSKWVIEYVNSGGTATIACGILSIGAQSGGSYGYVQMRANTAIGTGTLMEAFCDHPDAGLYPTSPAAEGDAAAELGYKLADMGWSTVMRMMDWPDMTYYCVQAATGGANSMYVTSTTPFDTDWHTWQVYRTTGGEAEFYVDGGLVETLGAPYIATTDLYPWLMAYARNSAPQSEFNIDWLRVRKYCGADAVAVLGAQQSASGTIFGRVAYGTMGLMGVGINLFDSGDNLVAGCYTDPDGNYLMEDIVGGEYTLEMIVPLGFIPTTETSVALTMAGGDVEVNFSLEPAAVDDVRANFWWWKKQFRYLEIGGFYATIAEVTPTEIEQYSQYIFDHFYGRLDGYAMQIATVTYIDDPPRPLTYEELAAFFLAPYETDHDYQVQRSLRTILLNIASGRMSQLRIVSDDGATASQALTYLVGLYLTGEIGNVATANINLQMMQVGKMIAAGVIPLDAPNVMYKQASELLPEEFALYQNYPNPFNPNTEIKFSLPHAAEVELSIYNIVGRKVATPLKSYLEAGTHVIQWNASDLASGVYLYVIKAEEFTQARKMTLIK